MAILPQILPLVLYIYWQKLSQLFSDMLYASVITRCENHLLVKLKNTLDFSEIETACAAFHHLEGAGRPASYPVSVLVRSLVVEYLYSLSLRELEMRLQSDLLVRWFVGLGAYEETPDHSTLERFEQWVIAKQARLFFDSVLRQVMEHFPQKKGEEQIGDTYAMRADAADEGLVKRLRHLCRILLRELKEALPAEGELCLEGFDAGRLFGRPQEQNNFFLDEAQRTQRRSETALAADELHRRVERLLSNYSSQSFPQVRRCLGHLSKVLGDEMCFSQNEAGEWTASELPRKDKGTFRIFSATDPEASSRVHKDDNNQEKADLGYNVQVAASPNGFIQACKASTGATPDQSGVADLVADQIAFQGNCPVKLIYDKAAGCGKTRAEVAQVSQGRCVVSARLIDFDKRSELFSPYDFSLSDDGLSLTCPNGKVSTAAYLSQSGDGRNFRFLPFQCWNGDPPGSKKVSTEEAQARRCPLWEQCREKDQKARSMRQVFISDYRQEILAAQLYNQSEAFQADMKLRPRIERTIFELTNYNGARRCRRRGLANADFQAKMCAMSYNLKLWMRRLGGGGGKKAA